MTIITVYCDECKWQKTGEKEKVLALSVQHYELYGHTTSKVVKAKPKRFKNG